MSSQKRGDRVPADEKAEPPEQLLQRLRTVVYAKLYEGIPGKDWRITMSRVLPILFNTDMVRAILDGMKTVTRRVIKPQPEPDLKYKLGICVDGDRNEIGKFAFGSSPCGERMHFVRPPCLAGDILYVRETWAEIKNTDSSHIKYVYRATDTYPFGVKGYIVKFKWRPSIHMPKSAASIWLKVTDVRVERIKEITEEQAEAEGGIDNRGFIHSPDNEYEKIHTAVTSFAEVWIEIF